MLLARDESDESNDAMIWLENAEPLVELVDMLEIAIVEALITDEALAELIAVLLRGCSSAPIVDMTVFNVVIGSITGTAAATDPFPDIIPKAADGHMQAHGHPSVLSAASNGPA